MKKYCLFLLLAFLINFFSCSKENYNTNPYLETFPFEKNINLNLPMYDNLRFSGGSILINNTLCNNFGQLPMCKY